jgi:hypothetical protein
MESIVSKITNRCDMKDFLEVTKTFFDWMNDEYWSHFEIQSQGNLHIHPPPCKICCHFSRNLAHFSAIEFTHEAFDANLST